MEQKIKNIEEVKKLDKNDDKQLMKNSEIIEEKNNNIDNKFTVFGYTLSKIVAYFVIYSFLGFIIETLFGLLTKGVVESRKSIWSILWHIWIRCYSNDYFVKEI